MEVGKIEQLTDGKKTTVYSTADLPHTPRVYQFARQDQEIKRLQTELDAAKQKIAELEEEKTALLELHKMAVDNWGDENKLWLEKIQAYVVFSSRVFAWSKEAYTRLNALMTIGVSMTPDAVTKRLLENAPESVRKSAG